MEWSVLNTISIDLPNIKIFLDFLDFGRDDVIGDSPNTIALSRALLIELVLWNRPPRSHERTGSSNVSQKRRSIKVTTRPGAPGVPRWSSLKPSTEIQQQMPMGSSPRLGSRLARRVGTSWNRQRSSRTPRLGRMVSYLPKSTDVSSDPARHPSIWHRFSSSSTDSCRGGIGHTKVRRRLPDEAPATVTVSIVV